MKKTRRKIDAALKAKIVSEALREQSTLTDLTQRYPALRAYLPLRARFNSAQGTYWRLSIQGFSNQREAIARCQQLKNNGGKCFVRDFAGDAPVQIASN